MASQRKSEVRIEEISGNRMQVLPIERTQLPPQVVRKVTGERENVALELQICFDEGHITNIAIGPVGHAGFALNTKTGTVGSPNHGIRMNREEMRRILPPQIFEGLIKSGLT